MKKAKSGFNWKRFEIIVGTIVVVLGLVFTSLYFTNRPNYRDLQKEYERISAFIPGDWQLVSESSNKGTWGLFCLGVDDSSCPYINNEYESSIYSDNADNIIGSLKKIVSDAGYVLQDNLNDKCDNADLYNKEYVCGVVGSKDGVEFYVDLSSSDSHSKKGNWASVRLSKNED